MTDDEDKNPIDMYFDMKEGRVKLAKKKDDGASSLLNKYLAGLRVLAIVYQHGHWKCKGSNFYNNHLLFQRLYEDTNSLSDATAEKLIGIYGNDSLQHIEQVSMIADIFSNYKQSGLIENAVEATEAFLQDSEDMYNRLKSMDELSLGLDDMIMANASKVEEFCYLLKQSIG